uniref:RNase H type-1 domain-containing protein n=1 Tax=Calidris pygmaea TaxID=425635 RepID=A0A8C3K4U2_9CHAR
SNLSFFCRLKNNSPFCGNAQYLYTDSWVVYKSLTMWLPHWAQEDWRVQKYPIWGGDIWQQIWQHVQSHPLKVRHVSAHQKDDLLESQNNREVDNMTSAEVHAQALNAHIASWDIHNRRPLSLHIYKTCAYNCTTCTQLHLRALHRPWGKIKCGQWALNTWQVDYIGLLPLSRGWQYVFTAVDTVSGLLFAKPTVGN